MMGGALKLGVATAAWALVHSALASRRAKEAAARAVGTRTRDGVYRAIYVAQSLATFGALLAYAARQPERTVYHVRGPLAGALRAGQAAGVLFALAAAREVGILRISGLGGAWAWLRGEEVPPPAAAQGPESRPDGGLTTGGPFRYTRHPLNLSPIPAFWLTPRLTTRRLAFNLVGTAYLVLGSLHEEARLREAYGEEYEAYLRGDVPFYLPRLSPAR